MSAHCIQGYMIWAALNSSSSPLPMMVPHRLTRVRVFRLAISITSVQYSSGCLLISSDALINTTCRRQSKDNNYQSCVHHSVFDDRGLISKEAHPCITMLEVRRGNILQYNAPQSARNRSQQLHANSPSSLLSPKNIGC